MLMEKLTGTGTHFVRCIKPNLKMVDRLFEGEFQDRADEVYDKT
jgi:myosin heavy subunit